MNYYQELTILPDPEISPYFIWGKLFMQVHLALIEQTKAKYGSDAKQSDIGVSFPDYRSNDVSHKEIATLGNTLRIFAQTASELEQLNLDQWLNRLSDYVTKTDIDEIESTNRHVNVYRQRQVKNMDRIARRYARRANLSFDQAKHLMIERYAEKKGISIEASRTAYQYPKLDHLPYINMESLNSAQTFSLAIKQTEATQAKAGTFNTYGMSRLTTVPHW